MKKTKRSLFTSLVTLLLCSAMFVGSTFAWFTDTASSTGNRIQAGTLDIDLLMYKKDAEAETYSYQSIDGGQGDIFKEAANANNSLETLWEPGKTQVVYLAVQNKGNLALKYQFYLDVNDHGLCNDGDENSSLEYILVPNLESSDEVLPLDNYAALKSYLAGVLPAVNFGDVKPGRTIVSNDGILDEISEHVAENEKEYFALIVHMKEDAGNVYQGKDCIIDVYLTATQYTSEEDGFGSDQYDAQAQYEEKVPEPQTDVIEKKIEDGKDTTFISSVTPSEETGKQTKVTIPKEVASFVADSTSTMTVKATPTLLANNTFTISSDGAVGAIDLKVEVDGVPVEQFKDSNEQPVNVKVETYVAKNMTNVTLSYNDDETWIQVENEEDVEEIGDLYYDKTTGRLVYLTNHFSRFILGANEVAYLESTNTAYLTPTDALNAVNNNGIITMIKDYKYQTSPSYLYSSKAKYTIDLNGYTLDLNDSSYGLYVSNGQTITISDSRDGGQLKNKQCVVYINDGGSVIVDDGHIGGADKDQATIYGYGNLTINGGIVDTAKKNGYDYYAVMIGNYTNDNTPAKFVMTDGEVNGSLYINGQDKDPNVINISGGSINGSSYIAGKNTTTITGGKFTGTTCFYFKAGTVNISGGTFTSTKGDGDWQHKDSACTNTGDAVIFEACNYPAGGLTMNVTGGRFKGYKSEGGVEPTSGNINFKNYGILVIDYAGDEVDCSTTTVSYQKAVVESNTDPKFLTENGYLHFTDDNTFTIQPN